MVKLLVDVELIDRFKIGNTCFAKVKICETNVIYICEISRLLFGEKNYGKTEIPKIEKEKEPEKRAEKL